MGASCMDQKIVNSVSADPDTRSEYAAVVSPPSQRI